MKQKIRLEEVKDFKIERKVFDERTLFTIYKLIQKGFIKSVESIVKEGKESLILSAKDKNNHWLAVKVYKTLHCDFKSRWNILALDPRFKALKKERRNVVYNWCKREFRNLKIAFNNNVSCPKPIVFRENVLVMSFIGENGIPAPRLIDIKLSKEELKYVYDFVLKEIEKLLKGKLIHGDLSAFNLLIHECPYLIDFSQAVTLDHPLANDFLRRDIENINSYFEKLGIKVEDTEKLFENFSKVAGLK